jgi:hypothetical protein
MEYTNNGNNSKVKPDVDAAKSLFENIYELEDFKHYLELLIKVTSLKIEDDLSKLELIDVKIRDDESYRANYKKINKLISLIYTFEAWKNTFFVNDLSNPSVERQKEIHEKGLSIISELTGIDKEVFKSAYEIFNLQSFQALPIEQNSYNYETRHLKYMVKYPKLILSQFFESENKKLRYVEKRWVFLLALEHFKRYMIVNRVKVSDPEQILISALNDWVNKYIHEEHRKEMLKEELKALIAPFERSALLEFLTDFEFVEHKLDQTYDRVVKQGADEETVNKAKEITKARVLDMIRKGIPTQEIEKLLINPEILKELLDYTLCKDLEFELYKKEQLIVFSQRERDLTNKLLKAINEIRDKDLRKLKFYTEEIKTRLRFNELYIHTKQHANPHTLVALNEQELNELLKDLRNMLKTYLTIELLEAKLFGERSKGNNIMISKASEENFYRLILLNLKKDLLEELIPASFRYVLTFETSKVLNNKELNDEEKKRLKDFIDLINIIMEDFTFYHKNAKKMQDKEGLKLVSLLCAQRINAIENFVGIVVERYIKNFESDVVKELSYSAMFKGRIHAITSEYVSAGFSVRVHGNRENLLSNSTS